MDPVIYFLAEFFPWWGIPLVLILGELSNFFRRAGKRVLFVLTLLICLSLTVGLVLYFAYGGFHKLRPAMQDMERQYGK